MLCTAPDRLERIGQVTGQPTPAGADKCAKVVHGAALFLSDVLAQVALTLILTLTLTRTLTRTRTRT